LPKRILDKEMEDLQFEILRMSTLVEQAVFDSVSSLTKNRVELARKVIEGDDDIDRLNLDVQDKCLRLLALRHPMAVDLRAVHTDLLVAMDLERMGDYAEAIARSTLRIQGKRNIAEIPCLAQMAEMVRELVHNSITSYILADVDTAENCRLLEDRIDNLYHRCFDLLVDMIKNDVNVTEMAVQLLFAGQRLERIADHATNIGESVLYTVTGQHTNLNE